MKLCKDRPAALFLLSESRVRKKCTDLSQSFFDALTANEIVNKEGILDLLQTVQHQVDDSVTRHLKGIVEAVKNTGQLFQNQRNGGKNYLLAFESLAARISENTRRNIEEQNRELLLKLKSKGSSAWFQGTTKTESSVVSCSACALHQ